MLPSLSISGIPHVGADIGGHFNNPDELLLVRWYQVWFLQKLKLSDKWLCMFFILKIFSFSYHSWGKEIFVFCFRLALFNLSSEHTRILIPKGGSRGFSRNKPSTPFEKQSRYAITCFHIGKAIIHFMLILFLYVVLLPAGSSGTHCSMNTQ